MKVKKSKGKKRSNGEATKVKSIEKPSKPPQWKKIKLSGNLMSDDGGFGLEGLLGLEVLENPAEAVEVTKEKLVKVKRTKAPVKEDASDESDTEHSKLSKNQRKNKKKKLLKKAKAKAQLNSTANNVPGRFVRPPPNDGNASNVIKKDNSKKKNKSKKPKQHKQSDDSTSDEPKLTIDDLIVRYSLDSILTFISSDLNQVINPKKLQLKLNIYNFRCIVKRDGMVLG